jgi:hypothetical protein
MRRLTVTEGEICNAVSSRFYTEFSEKLPEIAAALDSGLDGLVIDFKANVRFAVSGTNILATAAFDCQLPAPAPLEMQLSLDFNNGLSIRHSNAPATMPQETTAEVIPDSVPRGTPPLPGLPPLAQP